MLDYIVLQSTKNTSFCWHSFVFCQRIKFSFVTFTLLFYKFERSFPSSLFYFFILPNSQMYDVIEQSNLKPFFPVLYFSMVNFYVFYIMPSRSSITCIWIRTKTNYLGLRSNILVKKFKRPNVM